MSGKTDQHVVRLQAPAASSPLLERALLFTFLAHGAAMLSMLVLLPGMPGGPTVSVAARAEFVAAHPWLWRLGWLPWQITAVSDLVLAIALVRTKWVPRLPAVLALLVTLAAMVPDQWGQAQWTWAGPAIAAEGAGYEAFESRVFMRIAGWGTVGYLTGALCWTWCFAAAGVWSKRLTWLSVGAWSIFGIVTAYLMLAPATGRSVVLDKVVSVGNGAAFVLLMWWLFDVSEFVLRRSRPDAPYGRFKPWRHPSTGLFARAADFIANSRFVREIGDIVPPLAMASDITDVVYVNYLVEADRVEDLVPPPLKLQRLGPDGRYTVFTFLTFRHGHFGPRCFGPLRRLWPSPIQSNWRIHVHDPATGKRGIQFLTIAIAGTPYALIARMVAENVPMHVPAAASMSRSTAGEIDLRIEPGAGSSPDVVARFTPAPEPALTPPWSECLGTWREMLEYIVPQDRAMCVEPRHRRVVRQEINLDIPLESCKPMRAEVESRAVASLAGDAEPLCFMVDKLLFRLLNQEVD